MNKRRQFKRWLITSYAWSQCHDLGSFTFADVCASSHPEFISALLVQAGCFMSELIRWYFLAGSFLDVVSFRVNSILRDNSVRLARRAP